MMKSAEQGSKLKSRMPSAKSPAPVFTVHISITPG